jgi:choline-sulfatase
MATALATAIVAVTLAGESRAAGRPNFIVILTDDQSFDMVAALSGEQVQTPHLDELARRGLAFTRAYNMGSWSGAVCEASRTMLHTGRSLWRARTRHDKLTEDVASEGLWSQRLRRAGYRTYFSGKWHVNCDPHAVFDVVRHVRPGMPQQTPAGYGRPMAGRPDEWSASDPARGGYWQGGRHWSQVVADDALMFVQEASAGTQPFFIYLAFNAPHDPRQAPQEYLDRYTIESIDVPPSFQAAYPFAELIGCNAHYRDESLAPFPRTQHAVQVHRREYYSIISHLDAQIGRITRALDSSSARRNTYVFFTSDHGLALGSHGLFGKQDMYEHSVRVPLIVAGPGVPAGERVDAPVYLQDVMATTLELAGVPPDTTIDFRSFVPALRGETLRSYDAIYGAYLGLQRMITLDGYKLIVYPGARRLRLYHLARDPDELVDLAGDASYRPVLQRLLERLVQCQCELDDPLRLPDDVTDWAARD